MKEYIGNSAFPDKIRQNMESLTEADEMAEFMFLGLRMTEGSFNGSVCRNISEKIWKTFTERS